MSQQFKSADLRRLWLLEKSDTPLEEILQMMNINADTYQEMSIAAHKQCETPTTHTEKVEHIKQKQKAWRPPATYSNRQHEDIINQYLQQ